MICTIPLGVTAMCWGLVVGSVFSLVMNTYYTGKLIKVGFFIQMKDLLPTLVNSVIMGGIAYYIVNNIDSSIISLIAACSVSIVFYFTTSYLLKIPELKEVILIIKRK